MTFTAQEAPRLLARAAWQLPLTLGLGVLAVEVVGIRPPLVLFLYLAVVGGELCRIDTAEHRLPNALVLPGYAVAAVSLLWQGIADAAVPASALVAGAGYLAFLLLMNLAGGMGMGDVKLAGLLGIGLGSLGITAAVAGPVLAFVIGGVAGLVALLAPGSDVLRRIPFGPFMLLGFWLAVAASGALAAPVSI